MSDDPAARIARDLTGRFRDPARGQSLEALDAGEDLREQVRPGLLAARVTDQVDAAARAGQTAPGIRVVAAGDQVGFGESPAGHRLQLEDGQIEVVEVEARRRGLEVLARARAPDADHAPDGKPAFR